METELKTHDFTVMSVDTDALMFCKKDQSEFTEQERKDLLEEINSYFPDLIKFSDDGYYQSVIVLKGKTYALYDGKSIKIKGSALKASNKEIALRQFVENAISYMLTDRKDEIINLYNELAKEAVNVTDIHRWVSKKTITEKVLKPEHTTQLKIYNLIKDKDVQNGDKVWVYFKPDGDLMLEENFDGNYNKDKLLERLYKTVEILSSVLDIAKFPNYKLKKNKKSLEILLDKPQTTML
jgi:hypothetical protein